MKTRTVTNHLLAALFFIASFRGLRGDDASATSLLAKYAATHDVFKGKSLKIKAETVLAGDPKPSRFVFSQEEVEFLHADDRVKAVCKERGYDFNISKIGGWEVTEKLSDFNRKTVFPRKDADSKLIRRNPIVTHRTVRNFGDLLYEIPYAIPTLYGFVDSGSGMTIEEVLRQHGTGPPTKIELDGRSLLKLTARSKWGKDTAYIDPQRGHTLYKFERVKDSDSVVFEPNPTSKRTTESKVKDIVHKTEHPFYPTGVCARILYSLTVMNTGEYEGQTYMRNFVLSERKEFTNGKHYTFTHTVSLEDIRKADPAGFALETEVPDGTHVNVTGQKEMPIDYEWRHGEVAKSSDSVFLGNLKARFVRGGLWSWGAVALVAITASIGIAALVLRRRRKRLAGV